jgi:hypothetical protein
MWHIHRTATLLEERNCQFVPVNVYYRFPLIAVSEIIMHMLSREQQQQPSRSMNLPKYALLLCFPKKYFQKISLLMTHIKRHIATITLPRLLMMLPKRKRRGNRERALNCFFLFFDAFVSRICDK